MFINIIRWYFVIYKYRNEVVFVNIFFYGIVGYEVFLFKLDVEKSIWVFIFFFKSEVIDNFIIWMVGIIVDVDFVLDVFIELIVIWLVVW